MLHFSCRCRPSFSSSSSCWGARGRGRRTIGSSFPFVYGLVAMAICHCVQAQDAKIRASFPPQESVWVGQKMTVVVELLAPGIFSGPVNFDLPDPKGVLLLPPDGHPVVGNEMIDGVTYTVQRHELSAYPMQPGAQAVPPLAARFAFKRNPLDTNAVPVLLKTPDLPFQVKIPPGAEHLGTVISARDLEVEETWRPAPGTSDIKAGAAFTRTVAFRAPDMPAMVFPPFPAKAVDGLGVYPKTKLSDESDRGSLVGERQDTITYVCERPGRFTIPAARFTWFDLETQELRTKDFPEKILTVVANPAMASSHTAPDPAAPARPALWPKIVGGSVVILLVFIASLSVRIRRTVARLSAPFRPTHLQSLNP